MRNSSLVPLYAFLVVGSLLVFSPAAAAQRLPDADSAGNSARPPCKDCLAWELCRSELIQQKERLITAYTGLQAEFASETYVDRKSDPFVLDHERVGAKAWVQALAKVKSAFDRFEIAERERTSGAVVATNHCGLGEVEIELETDSTQCVIDVAKLDRAREALPCRDLYEIAAQHEAFHLQKCQQRKGRSENFPLRVLTPAGKAKEEVEAYTRDIEALKKIKGPRGLQARGPVPENRRGPNLTPVWFCFVK